MGTAKEEVPIKLFIECLLLQVKFITQSNLEYAVL